MPIGVVRGEVISAKGGELTIRGQRDTVYGCFYDAHTYFERGNWPATFAGLAPGDPVEVIADRRAGSSNCYARTVRVTEPRVQRIGRPRIRKPDSPLESSAPRGDMTFGGIVLRRTAGILTLRTRSGEQAILLRPDTRYVGEGMRADAGALLVNAHVFVRAGRDIDGNVEAYQVSWGEIVAK